MLFVAAFSISGPLATAAATEPVLGGAAPLQDDPKATPKPSPTQVDPGPPTPSEVPAWQKAQAPGEIVALRTRDSRTVKTTAGPLQTTFYAGSINYQDGTGAWHPIDDSLVAAPGGEPGYGFTNRANQYSALLPSDLNSAPVKVEEGSTSVSFQLAGAGGAATAVSGDSETYGNALRGVDLIYQATPDALKESIRLDGPTSPSSYAFTVSTSGVTAHADRAGAIDFADSKGKVIFGFARPTMIDAAGAESDSVRMALTGTTLTVAADASWLADPARRFPVVIDPTVTSFGADQNCYISAAATNTANCGPGVTTLKAGWDGTFARRTILQFNIQSNIFPNYSNVLSAELGLYLNSETTTSSATLAAYPITQSTGWTTSATWNNYDGTNAWSAGAGGTFDTSSSWSSTATAGGTTGTTIKWYPNKLAQAWLDGTIDNATTDNTPGEGTTNVGILVKQQAENVNNLLTFASSGDTTSSHRPYLQITYEPRYGELGYYKQISQDLNDRTKLLVNPGTGDLILKNEDLHIANAGIDFDVTRYFNNPNYNVFYMGNGWSLGTSRDVQLRLYPQSVAYYHDGSAAEVYQGTTSTSFTAPIAADADLSYTGSGTTDTTYCLTAQQYTMTMHKSLEKKTFYVPTANTGIALLCKDVDSNGNGLKFSYNTDLTPSTIVSTSDSSHSVTFTNTSGSITKIQDWSGRNVQYSYTSGNLTGYTDGGGKSYTYHYDASNNLTEVDDPNTTSNATQFTYDAGFRVTKVTKADGSQTPPNWQYSYSFATDKASGTTTETDPLSNVTTYTVDTKSRITNVKDAKNHNQPTTWSSDSAVAQYTDYSGNNTTLGYNAAGGEDVDTITAGSGNTSTFCFPGDTKYSCSSPTNNPTHMPSSSTDPQGRQTTYSYDGVNTGNLITASFANGSAAHQYFTNTSGVPSGLLGGYLDPKLIANCTVPNYSPSTTATVCFTYDSDGNVTQASYPSPLGSVSYTYDSLNRQHSVTDGKSQITGYCYDSLDRVTQTSHVSSTTFTCPMASADITKNYDNNGNLTSLVDGNGTTSYQYDHRNLMTQKTFPDLTTVNWTYDAGENLSTQVDGAGTTTYGYDVDNFLSSVTEPTTGRIINFSVDNNGNRTEIDYPTGTSTQHLTVVTMGYDGSNRMKSLKSVYNGTTTQLDLSYCFQSSLGSCSSPGATTDTGVLTQKTDNQSGNVTKYLYDALNRLCDARTTTSGGTQVSDYWYAFDDDSNRTKQIVGNPWTTSPVCSPAPTGGTATSYGYNNANELTTVGSNTYAFDGNGSETTGFLPAGTSLSLSYDNKNRVTSMTPSGGTAENEVYRGYPQNELLTWGGTTYKDGVLGTYRSATSTTSTYYVRDNRGHILESTSSGTRYFYVTDYQGSVLQSVDINGTIANTYSYDPYGNATKTGTAADNWTFIGGWQDASTNLYHLGARYYDPLVGRFTQQDLVQQANRYGYAAGNPATWADPSGLSIGFDFPGWAYGIAAGAACLPFDPVAAAVCGVIGTTLGSISVNGTPLPTWVGEQEVMACSPMPAWFQWTVGCGL